MVGFFFWISCHETTSIMHTLTRQIQLKLSLLLSDRFQSLALGLSFFGLFLSRLLPLLLLQYRDSCFRRSNLFVEIFFSFFPTAAPSNQLTSIRFTMTHIYPGGGLALRLGACCSSASCCSLCSFCFLCFLCSLRSLYCILAAYASALCWARDWAGERYGCLRLLTTGQYIVQSN